MIKIKVDDKAVAPMLRRLRARVSDLTPAMREISGIMLDAVEENFEQEGERGGLPRWTQRSLSTMRQRQKKGHWPGRTLQVSGGLVSSLTPSYDSRRAVVGVNKTYAAIHQFGGKAGRGGKVYIPARPFLRLADSDMEEIKAVLARHVEKGGH